MQDKPKAVVVIGIKKIFYFGVEILSIEFMTAKLFNWFNLISNWVI